MKAYIKELEGKYYGTKIMIKDGDIYSEINIWCSGDFTPSERELEQWQIGEFEVCDSHFESEWTYKLAQKIVWAIRGNVHEK